MCKKDEGDEVVCVPGELTDATKVYVQGQMTEAGVEVKRLTFVE